MLKRIAVITGIITVFFLVAPWALFSTGKILLDNNNYQNAASCFKNALLFNSNNKDYRYYYVKVLTKLKPDLYIQKEIFKIANDEFNDSAHQLAEQKVNEWKFNITKNIGENYIEQAPLHDGIIRWDTNKFPIKVAIQDESSKQLPDYYILQIKKALSQWQISTGFIKFSIIDEPKHANIIIKIQQLSDKVCEGNKCQYAVGFTTPEYSGKNLKNMTIILYSNNPFGQYFTDKELYNTVLHELGHALGIMGHSYNRDDLMYMSDEGDEHYREFRSSFQYLSSKDINTIKLLYKLVPDITNSTNINYNGLIYAPIILGSSKEIAIRKLKEAQNYIKKAPDLSNGYIDLGIIYMELNKPKNAEKAFIKAFELSKTDSERYIASYNIACTYLETKKYKEAKYYAEIAQNISDTEDVRKLLTEIKLHKKN